MCVNVYKLQGFSDISNSVRVRYSHLLSTITYTIVLCRITRGFKLLSLFEVRFN